GAVLAELGERDEPRLGSEHLPVEAQGLLGLASEVQVRVHDHHDPPPVPAPLAADACASSAGAEACAASQAGSERSSCASPAPVSSSSLSRASPVDADVTQPLSSSSSALRDSVVRSRPSRSASRVTVTPPVFANAARIENCVALRPVGRRCSS